MRLPTLTAARRRFRTSHTGPAQRWSRRWPRGSASVEFVLVVPFVLALVGAVWDLHAHIGQRTEFSREIVVAAEAAARDATGSGVLAQAMAKLGERLGRNADVRHISASGAIAAAVVTRGSTRHDGTACPSGAWCPPYVTTVWPPAGSESAGAWSHGGVGCRVGESTLPAAGTHFPANGKLLPRERDPAGEAHWPSRNLDVAQWWLVIDVCFEPRPGVFVGRLTNLPLALLDAAPVLRRRFGWGSVHDLGDCAWCGSGPP